jgi:hypothetical protein
MTKEFVNYKQALALKELGFDEPCFTSYDDEKRLRNPFDYKNSDYYLSVPYIEDSRHWIFNSELTIENFIGNKDLYTQFIAAPLYQQAFRWFRNEYNLVCVVTNDDGDIEYDNLRYIWDIRVATYSFDDMEDEENACISQDSYKTYEEAELACLIELIKIVKNKQS